MRFNFRRRRQTYLTSDSHPIPLDTITPDLLETEGKLVLTYAPGKKGLRLTNEVWDRDIHQDLQRLKSAKVDVLVNLMEPFELDMLSIPKLPERCRQYGIQYLNFPITDLSVPKDMGQFQAQVEMVANLLKEGKNVAVHCRGGKGRTGTFVAALLIHQGWEPKSALQLVRATRPGTVETATQEFFVLKRYPKFLGIPVADGNPLNELLPYTDLVNRDLHEELSSWKTDTPPEQRAYGGILFNQEGKVLLRQPTGLYDGYVWTFPKGRGDDPASTALREVLEETGYETEIIGFIPGGFTGGTSETFYFLMRPVAHYPELMDFETEKTVWVTPNHARALIQETQNEIGKIRDLAVLNKAVIVLDWLLGLEGSFA